jgi:formamidopyrimidine-DNA glycosylase
MPELPEVETIRRDLEPLVRGRQIVGVDVDEATLPLLAGPATSIEMLRSALVGRTVTGLGRRGKYLLFALDDGRTLVAHLRMTGRLMWRRDDVPAEGYERGRLRLDGGHDLRWSDLRKFGTWRVLDDIAPLVRRLGPEPIDEGYSAAHLRKAFQGRDAAVKSVLLDQEKVAGLGNIYVDEALFEAGVRPEARAGDLGEAATKRLVVTTREVLLRGIENRGASFRDYVDGQGNEGQQHMFVKVFRRTGKPCYTCGTEIERTVVGGRSTHYCPKCQRFPRRRTKRA